MPKSLNLQPFGPHLVIEILPMEEISDGGIVLPDVNQAPYLRGKIVAVGQGYRNGDGTFTPLSVKIGDIVLFNRHSGTRITYKARDYLILIETELWFKEN